MTKLILTFIFSLILSLTAFAQATGSIEAFATAMNDSNQTSNNLGAGFQAGYWFDDHAYAGVEMYSNDNSLPLRVRAGAFGRVGYAKHRFDFGAGYFRFGGPNTDGAYGQLGYQYEKFHAFGRLGNKRFMEFEAACDVARFGEHVTVSPFYRFTRHETRSGFPVSRAFAFIDTVQLHQVGLRLRFR